MKIVPDTDYRKLSRFWRAHGLEVQVSDTPPDSLLHAWSMTDPDGTLVAAAALERRNGFLVLADVAVDPAYRGSHHGVALVTLAEETAAAMGAPEIWLTGKVPDFYRKLGWQSVPRQDAPPISKCLHCEDFQVSCHPEIMRKVF